MVAFVNEVSLIIRTADITNSHLWEPNHLCHCFSRFGPIWLVDQTVTYVMLRKASKQIK